MQEHRGILGADLHRVVVLTQYPQTISGYVLVQLAHRERVGGGANLQGHPFLESHHSGIRVIVSVPTYVVAPPGKPFGRVPFYVGLTAFLPFFVPPRESNEVSCETEKTPVLTPSVGVKMEGNRADTELRRYARCPEVSFYSSHPLNPIVLNVVPAFLPTTFLPIFVVCIPAESLFTALRNPICLTI